MLFIDLMANSSLTKVKSIPPIRFVQEVWAELKKVTWPSRQETIKLTLVVITVAAAIGFFVGGLDILFINLSRIVFR